MSISAAVSAPIPVASRKGAQPGAAVDRMRNRPKIGPPVHDDMVGPAFTALAPNQL